MKSIFDLHNTPELLDGYFDRIKLVPVLAHEFAMDQTKRSPELEPILARDAEYAYWYAKSILRGRFFIAERTIMVSPFYAYMYARNILGARWYEAEPYIEADTLSTMYYNGFIRELNFKSRDDF